MSASGASIHPGSTRPGPEYLADRSKASSVNLFTRVDPNTFTWRSFGPEVAGQFMPDQA